MVLLRPHAVLEAQCRLHARIIAETEMLRTVQRITCADPFRTERIESFQQEVLHRNIAYTDGEAADTVQIPIRQCFRAVPAEERPWSNDL